MSPTELLRILRTLGGVLEPLGRKLHVDAPLGTLSEDLRDALREHWREVLEILREEDRGENSDGPGNTTPAAPPLGDVHVASAVLEGGHGNGTSALADAGPISPEVPLPVAKIVGALESQGVWLEVRGDDLAWHGPVHLATPGLRDLVDRKRSAFVGFLTTPIEELTDEDLGYLGYLPEVRERWTDDDCYTPPAGNAAGTDQPRDHRCCNPRCGTPITASISERFGGYCWGCSQTHHTARREQS